jgi:hypothetical protein
MDAQALRLTEERPPLGQAGIKAVDGEAVEVRLRGGRRAGAVGTAPSRSTNSG